MNQEEVVFDINETIEQSLTSVLNPGLKKTLENFKTRVTQISSGNSLAFIVMHQGLTYYKLLRYWMEESVKISGFNKETPEHMETLHQLINERFKSEMNNNYEQAFKSVQEFRKQDKDFWDASYNNSLNSLVNIWTAFETTIKTLWVYSLDNHPKLFINEVLSQKGSNEIIGIEGKNISIGLLAKYDFNISNCLGSVLYKKFDFTSINGIIRCVQALLGENNSVKIALDYTELRQLEIIRNVIVHSSGFIDNDYIQKTTRKHGKIGERINLSIEEMRTYGDSCLYPTIIFTQELDKFINEAFAKNS